jgi:hypothetical protein
MQNGIIEVGTRSADNLGLTEAHFNRHSFLRRDENRIILSYVLPRHDDDRAELVKSIKRAGFIPATVDLGSGEVRNL